MITPQKMSEFEKNKIIDMFSKLNQDLTSSIIKKLQQNEDISSFCCNFLIINDVKS